MCAARAYKNQFTEAYDRLHLVGFYFICQNINRIQGLGRREHVLTVRLT